MQSRRGISAGRLVAYIAVALVVGGVFVGFKMYQGKIEQGDDPFALPSASALSKYLAEQHRSASVNPGALALTDASKMSDTFANWLGQRTTVEELVGEKPSVTFLGARPSAVPLPQTGVSVQLVFSSTPSGGAGNTASLFLKKYMLTDASYIPKESSVSLPGGGPGLDTTVIWHKGGLLYILVGPAQPMEALKKAMGCPAPSGEYKGG